IQLVFELRYFVPEMGRNAHSERKTLTVVLEEFRDHGVVYPAAPLRPNTVDVLYGREQLLKQIAASLSPAGQSVLYFLEGLRQVGKTSMLHCLPAYLKPDIASCYVNLDSEWPDNNIYKHISNRVLRALDSGATATVAEAASAGAFLNFVGEV